MGVEIAALMGFFGLTSAFALVAMILAAWMAWRIVEKTGLPGWAGLGAILLTLTGVGSIVPLVLLWVFAYMRWPRDEAAGASLGYGAAPAGGPARPAPTRALGAAGGSLGRPAGMEARRQPARRQRGAHRRRIGHSLCPDRRARRAAHRALGARSVGRPAARPAADRRRPSRAGGPWEPPAGPSSTARACCPSTVRATSARPARSAWHESSSPCRGPEGPEIGL